MVVYGADRVPDIEELNLEKAGVMIEKGAIEVDKHMKTSNPRIYAGMEFAASKVIIDEANDRIMGACILGPNAGKAISIFAAVIRPGLKHRT